MKNYTKNNLVKYGLLMICLLAGNINTFAGGVKSFDPNPDLYILSIGINKYEDQKMKLQFSVNDANSLSDEFEKRGKYKFGKVKKYVLTDANAKRQDILNALDDLSREMSSNDYFVFSFSGMGSHFQNDGLTGEFYLIPQDGTWSSVREKGISNKELQSYFRKIRAENKLIILDSCESASGFESAMNTFFETDENIRKLTDENTLFIGSDAITYEEPKLQLGAMSSVVLDAIRGKADFDEDGEVTFREIEFYMYLGAKKHNKDFSQKLSPRTVLRGKDLAISDTDQKIREIALQIAKAGKSDNQAKNQKNTTRTAETYGQENESKNKEPEPRKGKDYAVLFANQDYDNDAYDGLKNPYNDVEDIKKELEERYGFEVIIKKDLTTQQIRNTLREYETADSKKFNFKEDQILFFFAGHGLSHQISKQVSDGFYVGKDSPYPFTEEDSGKFVNLDWVVNNIEGMPFEHAMVVFDACYSGKMWTPKTKPTALFGYNPMEKNQNTAGFFQKIKYSTQSNINYFDETRLILAKQKMKNRTRLSITSGAEPVRDSWEKEDGTLSDNSPFADAFLSVLRKNGGKTGLVITADFMVGFKDKSDNLTTEPQVGKISDKSDGDFVFVKQDKSEESKR